MKNHGEWYTLGGTILFVIIVSIVGFIDWHGENKDYSKEYRRIENLIEQWIHNIGYDINSGRILEYIDAENLAVFLALAEEMYKDQIAISSKYLEKIEEIKRIRQDRSSYTILEYQMRQKIFQTRQDIDIGTI
jgi:hypothetical protein